VEQAMTDTAGTTATEASPERDATERSTGELVGQLSEQVTRLIQDEARLAWREVQRKGARAGVGAGLFGAAGVLALYGGGAVVAGLVLVLAMVLPAWVAALVLGGAILLVAAITALVGRAQLRRAAPPVPDQAVASVREDLAVIKQHARAERNHPTGPGPASAGEGARR
jgi:membrane protein